MVKEELDIKLIALDIDGTLLNDKHEVSKAVRDAIREAEKKGITVVLSTGRSLATCKDYAVSLQLSSYLVTVNGAEIWGPDGELVVRNPVDLALIRWMYDLSTEHKTGFWATSSTGVVRGNMPEDFETREWLKFGFDIPDDKVRETIANLLKERGELEISNSSPTNIEVNAIGINKAAALHQVCALLEMNMENVMAVGDSLNDILMIKEAGLGIAMGNAQDVVKEAADWVTSSNNEDGVARAIREWVL
ncbi:phosphoglycolate phosphatase, TA0175-type [Bacillus sp. FJAT-27225]|uniref:Cof-type HAD-IIB family hydrolase n=1 Tax=Bacillus sp. FJAT-27225 TaxID=1743144 RepID=UPI00080C2236|nr:Cof-type HAD-IIB family hydrolase [Bacillus sp. FJAT-27225]OCA81576.1 phosphoglycolate phosphatase, TA0175-type [Bacillus sp. FJAT-27225]